MRGDHIFVLGYKDGYTRLLKFDKNTFAGLQSNNLEPTLGSYNGFRLAAYCDELKIIGALNGWSFKVLNLENTDSPIMDDFYVKSTPIYFKEVNPTENGFILINENSNVYRNYEYVRGNDELLKIMDTPRIFSQDLCDSSPIVKAIKECMSSDGKFDFNNYIGSSVNQRFKVIDGKYFLIVEFYNVNVSENHTCVVEFDRNTGSIISAKRMDPIDSETERYIASGHLRDPNTSAFIGSSLLRLHRDKKRFVVFDIITGKYGYIDLGSGFSDEISVMGAESDKLILYANSTGTPKWASVKLVPKNN
jgi:hypothetical protein